MHAGTCTLVDCMSVRYIYDSNVVVLSQIYIYIITSGYVFSSVQSLAHHDLCSGSLPHVETAHRVAAAAGPGCDAAASMPQPETLLEKSSSLVLPTTLVGWYVGMTRI